MGRPAFSFLLIDMPSDHEVDENLATECNVIRAILHNRGFKAVIKTNRMTSLDSYNAVKWSPYKEIGFVHLAGHGTKKGICLIGGDVAWGDVATKLKLAAPALVKGQKRVLTLSCCHSKAGVRALTPLLAGHFTGIYHFEKKRIGFADAMTTWAMFYKHKTLGNPHAKVVEKINGFFEDVVLAFATV